MKAAEVEVEVRLWATEPDNHLVRIPVAERGVLVADHPESEDEAPKLLVGDQPFTPWSEEAFAAVLLVTREPTRDEAELLRAAVAVGYCIEPRVVGQPWRDMERLTDRSGTFWGLSDHQ
jgi:hypothetical protein